MSEKRAIAEEMGIHKEWYDARPTREELPEFIRHLTEDYYHDYGPVYTQLRQRLWPLLTWLRILWGCQGFRPAR